VWIAVWERDSSAIVASRSVDNGATWAPFSQVDRSGNNERPFIASTEEGRWVIAWQTRFSGLGGDYDVLHTISYDNGLTWPEATPLNADAASLTTGGQDQEVIVAYNGGDSWLAMWASSGDVDSVFSTDYDVLIARFGLDTNDCNANQIPDHCEAGIDADYDGDGIVDVCDFDDDNDGLADVADIEPTNADVCGDMDDDLCDDCVIGTDDLGPLPDVNPAEDGEDTDADGLCDPGDMDDDNDGVTDGVDSAPMDPGQCGDEDGDACDDCAVGTDGFGPLVDANPAADGPDADGDGNCDESDGDDDNDGVVDLLDPAPSDPHLCSDTDEDTCDDCAVGLDGFGPLPDANPASDGPDADADGVCNASDDDDDNDGVLDVEDVDPLDPMQCDDADEDACDDCAVGADGFGPRADNYPGEDGPDTDADGVCDAGDEDDDNDGVEDSMDPAPLDPEQCGDADEDACDDCAVGTDGWGPLADVNPAADGPDTDGDGACDQGDNDDDNDGVEDTLDSAPLDPGQCEDADADTCDDCALGVDGFGSSPDNDPSADGLDSDKDGTCDAGDSCPFDRLNDGDGDGVCDSTDACLGGNDAMDSDEDGVPDFCDVCPAGDDAFDEDKDGSPDACDRCPFDAAGDSDGDGVCDAEDRCPGFDDNSDADLDTVPDGCDNCLAIANSDQADCDRDGVGDACRIADGLSADIDDNGVPDECEVIPVPVLSREAMVWLMVVLMVGILACGRRLRANPDWQRR
jgi:hypothetical protein